ncbi:hypothetical protein BKA70DRAFT_1526941 [Coprinopsis sp. MPI-PUGE-AT-0042]|nr:hypothetical protein BKA70DRAFT_1526941 [Coprinopsis sp. MPI-PUGE-AT-0042]
MFPSFEVEQLIFSTDDLWKQYAIPIPPRRSSGSFTNGITTASSVPAHIHWQPSWWAPGFVCSMKSRVWIYHHVLQQVRSQVTLELSDKLDIGRIESSIIRTAWAICVLVPVLVLRRDAEDTSEDDRRGKLRKSVHRNGLYSRCFTFDHNGTPSSLIRKSRRIPLIISLPPGELSIRLASKLVKRGCSDVRHGRANQIPLEIRLILAMRPKNVNASPTSCPSHELRDHLVANRALSKLPALLTGRV